MGQNNPHSRRERRREPSPAEILDMADVEFLPPEQAPQGGGPARQPDPVAPAREFPFQGQPHPAVRRIEQGRQGEDDFHERLRSK